MKQIRPGYKQTEVGLIPEDWNVHQLGKLILSAEYGSSAKSKPEGKVPVLRMGNLQDGKIAWDDLVYTDDESEAQQYALKYNDVLFNRTNTIDLVGKTSIYRSTRPAIFAGYLIRIKVNPTLLNPIFLNSILNTEVSRQYSRKVLSVAVGQANINAQKLKTYPIPLPPAIAEQDAIAEALCNVDALIESLEQLIGKKRNLKQAAIQQLLTGQRRLLGSNDGDRFRQTEIGRIPEDWDISTVGQEFDIQLGKMLDAEKNTGVLKSYLGNRAVQWNQIDTRELQMMAMTPSDLERYRLKRGDLLVCEGGEVGRAAIWNAELEECYYQKALHRLRPLRGYNTILMVELLRMLAARGFLLNYVTQTSIAHLPKDKFVTVPIPVPSLIEQSAIAAVLSDMNAEMTVLEQRLDKTRALKQGMMQELLTGRTRLV